MASQYYYDGREKEKGEKEEKKKKAMVRAPL
jgi:hypothetical protein